jgi:hypothetical protein
LQRHLRCAGSRNTALAAAAAAVLALPVLFIPVLVHQQVLIRQGLRVELGVHWPYLITTTDTKQQTDSIVGG